MGYYDEHSNHNQESSSRFEGGKKPSKPSRWKPVLSSITSGVVGGMIVLGVYPMLDKQQESPAVQSAPNEQTASQSASKSANVQTVSNSTNVADVAENLSPAIVGIANLQQSQQSFSDTAQESSTGSGVIFKKDGKDAFILTNNHVVEGAQSLDVSLSNGKKAKGELVGADPLTDLAVLRINADEAPGMAPIGDSSKLRAGEKVIAIGNPLGIEFSRTVTEGIISGTDRSIQIDTSKGPWELNVLQTDAAINPGNSGGPLINMNGEVIGINSLKISQNGVEGLGFAIPSNDVMPIANQLMEKGQIDRPFLGVTLGDIEQIPPQIASEQLGLPEGMTTGVYLEKIQSGSPAEKGGLERGDVITALDGKKVKNSSELRKYLYESKSIGDKVKVTVYRDGKKQEATLTLTAQE
ncbi:trypsin-like peptidase domain-containing protein [Metabacillus sp. KIGAM252]|uniref:Trypsin-like peptidase domain-containing protein n=1 Tax=Metabacillus flavus TaxID=2823519 RepID=A0ABS5LID1_9BACI|nr:trypsin-like peptidase domain-containing protein [Metabacillus flavus]MBS2970497.1 trypsin-like peptidase domain-containing protein [Metabacillus flavus]